MDKLMKGWRDFMYSELHIWRFKKWLRLPSRLFCLFGLHSWITFEGRPVNCGVCGKMGHPLAYKKLHDILKSHIDSRMEKDKQENIEPSSNP